MVRVRHCVLVSDDNSNSSYNNNDRIQIVIEKRENKEQRVTNEMCASI